MAAPPRRTRSHRTAAPRLSLGRGAHRLGQPAPSPDRRRLNLRSHTDTDRLGDSSRCNASHCDASQSGPGQFPRPVPNGSAITSQPSGARLCRLHNVQHKSRCDVQVHSTTFAFSTQSMRSRCCRMTTCQSLRSQALQRQALRFQSQRFQSRRGQSLRCQSQCDPGRYDMTAGHLPELTSSSHRCTRCHRCHRCHRSFSQTDTMPDHLHDALGNTIRASESFNQPPISTVDQHIRSAHSISSFDQYSECNLMW